MVLHYLSSIHIIIVALFVIHMSVVLFDSMTFYYESGS